LFDGKDKERQVSFNGMKISLEWLSEFIDWKEHDPHVIADRLTLSTAEVEEVDVQGALLNHVVVGEIVSVARHPDADRLSIAEVKTDKGIKKVVCGGTNVKEGMQVAFAHIGATVKWHGGETMTLAPVKIRGVASEGMICAGEELDLAAQFSPLPEHGERPIIDLTGKGFKTGDSLKKALGLNDAVLHVNNTAITIRPDLFSHLGFARECVALGLATWKDKPGFKLPSFPKTKPSVKLHIDEPTLVPRYLACMIEVDGAGETPEWMKRRLEAVGVRSISLPVDITNYVASEIGVPMHCFDAGDIQGDVKLRLSKKNEKIVTLDEEERTLPEGVLVLSDDAGVFDLLGIMGGLRSSTKASTKKMFLHALSIDPPTIRRAIISTAHRTDAATVYEKGVPPITTEQGFIRALQLFTELVPGARIASSLESKGENGKPVKISLETAHVRKALGADYSDEEISDTLETLDFHVTKGTKKGHLNVTPPLHRLRDVSGVHDIVEEIGRIRGFESIAAVMPNAPMQLPVRDKRMHTLRDALRGAGYWETVPLSFVSPAMLQKCNLPVSDAITIANPLGEETSLMQTHTLPRLLAQAEDQLPQSNGILRTFQWSHVFSRSRKEHAELSALYAAGTDTNLLEDPFLHMKQDILNAAKKAGYTLEVREAKTVPPFAHPGRAADIVLNGKVVGTVCEIHPSVRKNTGLPFRAAAATLDLEALFAVPPEIVKFKPVSSLPAVTYDLTIKRTRTDALGSLMKKFRGGSDLLEDVSVIDLYDGKPLTNGEYNLTLRFTYRSPERTLTEAEVKAAHEKVLTSAGINL
jgi:phenylalanyl-tRNA synthetase beta chain